MLCVIRNVNPVNFSYDKLYSKEASFDVDLAPSQTVKVNDTGD
jgi:hypothetical protein